MSFEDKLISAVTQYDELQSRKKSWNPRALGIYITRANEIASDVRRGAGQREAIIAGFTGSILSYVLRKMKLSPPTRDEFTGAGRMTYRAVRQNPPFYAHNLYEKKTHGLNLKQMRRLYAMVSRGNQKAITYARNVLGIPFSESPTQVKAVVYHHVRDLAERRVRRNPGGGKQGWALVRGGGPTGMKMVVVSIHKTKEGAESAMMRKGGTPDSQFTRGYSIHAFGPGTRYEYLDSEFTGKFLRPLSGNPSRTRYMLVDRRTGKPISDVATWGREIPRDQLGYTVRDILTLRKHGIDTGRFKTVLMKSLRRNPASPGVTPVVFRTFRSGGDVIALFPYELGTMDSRTMMSYEHIGQHGSADMGLTSVLTRPSTPDEIRPLKNELERIGYKLKILKRIPGDAVRVRAEKLRSIK